uniref:Uncharacterized protein n=1 Tax=uncultured prokaryote TaxID=198431 RepID=A0A0H5Q7C5_9ZZZZ|nr:hypothetical protein [uncultured prokaryote]
MTIYKFQATSVGFWRGQEKRWQNTFHYDASNDAAAASCLSDFNTKILALGSTTVHGGLASVAVYNTATGGVPVLSQINFPWETSSSWIGWPGAGPWGTGLAIPLAGEPAARFRTQAGVGKTGKPVYVGIYWHSFMCAAETTSAVQFTSTVVTAASTLYNNLQTLSSGGTALCVQVTPAGGSIAGSGTLLPYVDAHQRTRGRRRKSVSIDGKKYYPAAKSSDIVPVEAD